jgi:hypothetical protein
MYPRIENNNCYQTIDEGNRSSKTSKSVILFLWSLFSNFSSRNAAEFNDHEHNLYRQLGNMFYLRGKEYKCIISDWKANAWT